MYQKTLRAAGIFLWALLGRRTACILSNGGEVIKYILVKASYVNMIIPTAVNHKIESMGWDSVHMEQ